MLQDMREVIFCRFRFCHLGKKISKILHALTFKYCQGFPIVIMVKQLSVERFNVILNRVIMLLF